MNVPPPIVLPSRFGRVGGVMAALSTRHGGVSGPLLGMNLSFSVGDDEERVRENRRKFFGALGIGVETLALMRQVHGDTITRVDVPGTFDACDGIITDQPGLFLCVTVADCVPVFILDREVRALAVVHAGWRGTAARIVECAVDALRAAYHASPARMEAFVGPAAGKCCYEVGDDIASRFDEACVDRSHGEPRLDLKGANLLQLVAAGLPREAVEVHPSCTIHEATVFHSFRRDGTGSGRMMGVAGFPAVTEKS